MPWWSCRSAPRSRKVRQTLLSVGQRSRSPPNSQTHPPMPPHQRHGDSAQRVLAVNRQPAWWRCRSPTGRRTEAWRDRRSQPVVPPCGQECPHHSRPAQRQSTTDWLRLFDFVFLRCAKPRFSCLSVSTPAAAKLGTSKIDHRLFINRQSRTPSVAQSRRIDDCRAIDFRWSRSRHSAAPAVGRSCLAKKAPLQHTRPSPPNRPTASAFVRHAASRTLTRPTARTCAGPTACRAPQGHSLVRVSGTFARPGACRTLMDGRASPRPSYGPAARQRFWNRSAAKIDSRRLP